MNKVRVAIPAWILERKIILLYLVINEDFGKEFSEMVEMAPEKKFYELVAKHVNAYLQEGMMPPTEIAPAIMNLIDDYKAGRSMTLRAGDYISLQNYLRKGK
ncbi:MAG: hypothetical protein J5U17_06590 [Candidatus Methanoperedens sp.]|nr:hypothetical protein [Candidatus Methanoperedens sp.]MCE8427836.1 hypothetical protein [Candidatus Methanoperedens sp.]